MKKFAPILVAVLLLASSLTVFGATGLSYTSGFQLQNLSATSQAAVVIDFYAADGTAPAGSQISDLIPAAGSKTYFPLGKLPSGFAGSAVVSSDQQVAAITNVYTPDLSRGDSYKGLTQGAPTISLPLLFKARYGIDSWVSVQNTTSTDTQVTMNYTGGGLTGPCSEGPLLLKGNGSHIFDQSTVACLPTKFNGSATISSTGGVALAAVVMEVTSGGLQTYTGFTAADASLKPIMPLIQGNWYGGLTGIQMMNTGNTPTNVTVSFTPSLAGTACTETHSIPVGQATTFGYPMPAACGAKFAGSAVVSANSASQPLVGIVNQINLSTPNASSYAAFNPAAATSKVSLPIINDRNYGIFTGISVVNMGTQPTNINCTFTNNAHTASANNVQPGAALVDVQLNQMAAGYVGSATCTATGGDAKIGAIVNQLRNNMPTQDVLLTYPGINF